MPRKSATKLTHHCIRCRQSTNHTLLFEKKIDVDDEEGDWWTTRYQVVQCCGCEQCSFRTESADSMSYDPNNGTPYVRVESFPSAKVSARALIEDIYLLPLKTRRIYQETIDAINNSSHILACIGLRALIEAVCIDQKVTGKNLEARISKLADSGVLSAKQATILHSHRFMGNVAAHEIESADPREIVLALEIAETVLKVIYIVPAQAESIRAGKPR